VGFKVVIGIHQLKWLNKSISVFNTSVHKPNLCILNADYETGPYGYLEFGRKNPPSSLYLSIIEHEAYILDRSDILNTGNKNIVLYCIEFMPAMHRPTLVDKMLEHLV
jgi:hypothetical protein